MTLSQAQNIFTPAEKNSSVLLKDFWSILHLSFFQNVTVHIAYSLALFLYRRNGSWSLNSIAFVIGSIIFFILNLFIIKKALVGVADLQELNKNKVSTWKAFNLVTPSVVRSDFLLILLTICPKFLWHKFGEIGVGLTDYLLIVNSLHSPHLSAWYCIEIVRRNSVLVTHSWEFNPLNPKSDWHLISP